MKLRKSSVFCSTLYRIQAWFTRVAGVAIGLALLGTGVAYAEDGQLQPGIVEEIVVTASKREERLMDVRAVHSVSVRRGAGRLWRAESGPDRAADSRRIAADRRRVHSPLQCPGYRCRQDQ